MSFEISGKLVVKHDVQEITAKFKKREFVIEVKDNSGNFEFIDYIKFQLTQDKCTLIDGINTGEDLKVSFNLRGRKWEKDGNISYFTNLEAWRIEKLGSSADIKTVDSGKPALDDAPLPDEEDFSSPDQEFDDLPF